MSANRRFTISLVIAAAVAFWLIAPTGQARGRQAGFYLTPNGYKVPVYGMSAVRDAEGHSGTECVRLTDQQIASARLGRSVSRAMAALSPRSTVQADPEIKGATFQIIYTDAEGTGFNDRQVGAARKRALEASLAAWSKVLAGTIPIVVQARMEKSEDPESQLLASAGPVELYGLEDIAWPTSLISQLLDEQIKRDPSDPDIEVVFNPDVDWDYVTNGAAGGDKVSFVYVTIHEIGHGLGFIDSFVPETGELLNEMPFPYDLFVNRGSSRENPLLERTSDEVKNDLHSRDLFFAGENAMEASRRSIRPLPMVKLYAPDPYEPGSSIAHVDQETYADFKVGLMTPKDFGSGTDKIDILTLGIMEDMGYTLVPEAVTARVPKLR